jgi:serine/threonine-protein kinase
MNAVEVAKDQDIDSVELEGSKRAVALLTGGRYEVIRPLARGGMSLVLLGLDWTTGRRVALKLLDPLEGATVENRERFRREAIISADLDHPHIVPCYQYFHQGRLALAVMRFIPGHSLAERLGEDGRLSVRQTLALLIPLTSALSHAHHHGVVHRDVKPDNILLRDDDNTPFLTDFGIATLRTSDQSRSEVARGFGTPAFMAPEQVLGRWDADSRTDIYSLGLVAYRCLAGRLPFKGQSAISLAAQRTARAAAPIREMAPEVPARLAAIIDRCLLRNPQRRWRDANVLHEALILCRERLSGQGFRLRSLVRRIRLTLADSRPLTHSTATPLPS